MRCAALPLKDRSKATVVEWSLVKKQKDEAGQPKPGRS